MKRLGRFAIIAFCMWHMFAIAVYVIPGEATNPKLKSVENWALTYVRPYMFMTSQWQKWNIFSPNPIRRVSFYAVDIKHDEGWEPLFSINPHNLPWWKRSRELKIMRRVEEDSENAGSAYLNYVCRTNLAPGGSLLRLRKDYYVIPTATEIAGSGGWSSYMPDISEEILREYYCPIV